MDRADFARAQAAEFNSRTIREIAKVLESHSAGVIEFALEMQRRLDEADGLLAEVAASRRSRRAENIVRVSVNNDLLSRLDAHVETAKRSGQ